MSNEISMDDLLLPQLSHVQRSALAWGDANPVLLPEADILEAARMSTGQTDFGLDDFREALKLLLDAPLTATRPLLGALSLSGRSGEPGQGPFSCARARCQAAFHAAGRWCPGAKGRQDGPAVAPRCRRIAVTRPTRA